MNERLLNKYKELLAQFAECQRRVLPVVNTCLNNITEASNFVDAVKVRVCVCVGGCVWRVCVWRGGGCFESKKLTLKFELSCRCICLIGVVYFWFSGFVQYILLLFVYTITMSCV